MAILLHHYLSRLSCYATLLATSHEPRSLLFSLSLSLVSCSMGVDLSSLQCALSDLLSALLELPSVLLALGCSAPSTAIGRLPSRTRCLLLLNSLFPFSSKRELLFGLCALRCASVIDESVEACGK